MLLCIAIPSLAQTLPRYSCQSKHFDVDLWMKQYKRTFDQHGVVLQDSQYHPLSIAVFGIMKYDQYLSTHDTLDYRHVLNQYAYFSRPGNITWIDDDKGAGLPYRKPFKDMKVPWYSGMTQGVAISFVLRYYALTQDPTAKVLAQKLAYFMLRPVDEGGTIAITPEALTWIEEYPKSQKSTHVLNGFINGLIGLHEYLIFFPEDTLARAVHDRAYAAMVKSFPKYDTHDWTNYNRNMIPVSNQYMRYQLMELEHLYELYQDPALIRQMMIWASFAYLKRDKEIQFYRNPDFQYGHRMQVDGTLEYAQDSLFFAAGFRSITKSGTKEKSMRLPLSWRPNKPIAIDLPWPTPYLVIRLSNPLSDPRLSGKAVNDAGAPIPLEFSYEGDAIHVHSCASFSKVSLRIEGSRPKPRQIKDIEAFDPDNIQVPHFIFDTLSPTPELTKGQSYRLTFDAENTCDLTIFYKHSTKSGIVLKRTSWQADQFIADPGQPFIAPSDGYYKFFYAFRYVRPNPSFRNFEIKPWE
ncbi:MAG: D-glucuronyl C5-epimerase family protein [Bacteroidia bacterium]